MFFELWKSKKANIFIRLFAFFHTDEKDDRLQLGLETFLFGRNFAQAAIVSTEEDRQTKREHPENAGQPGRSRVDNLSKMNILLEYVDLILDTTMTYTEYRLLI